MVEGSFFVFLVVNFTTKDTKAHEGQP